MEDEGLIEGLAEDDLIDDAEVDTMVRESISGTLGDNQFLHAKIDSWSTNVVEGCLKRLAALNKPFKYVVTCNLTQKAGAGLHAASCTRCATTPVAVNFCSAINIATCNISAALPFS